MNTIQEWFDFLHIDFLQCAVLILGVSEVLLARANNVWLYPTGIAATVLSIYSLFNVQLYAECLLAGYYIVMSIYGWWYWLRKPDHFTTVPVTYTTKREWYVVLSIVAGGWLLLYGCLTRFTTSEVPGMDAWISCTGWAGMWLLARRKVENWILLNISNAFAIPLLFYKDLPLFAVLTLILFIVACKGYFDWTKIAKPNTFSLKNLSNEF
jgi:nicotinamide mononucleotide transporter